MIQYASMQTVTWLTALTVFILLWAGTRTFPLIPVIHFLKKLASSPRYLLHFGALLAILFLNKWELTLEENMNISSDFTGFIHSLEGGFVSGLQNLFYAPWMTSFLSFMYLIVFQSLLIVSIGIYTYKKNYQLFYATCYAVMLNYLIAIPFYLFFPVKEVWAFDPTVQFRMLDVFPSFESQYRELSGLDNCFPSLHTSMSVTMAMLAFRSGIKGWAWFCGISASIIIFSIFYLGIHWLTDMLGGVMLGLFASLMGVRIAQLRSLPGKALGKVGMLYARDEAK
ncbi:inositol phosphorylceramide synthase [Paenibacillus sambharensis]|uniref:Inositol phosphorylceramide synthase n=1 Tax=Paenibacillus sambharensis TaxID=1803190 RepID=A0A2W1L5G3_9BACL|nr:phosphatase PAP2 family protein [Paenibacillus sambharensis]PZD94149.1 inositol phosphorylceramide synthase [Paenibacillus sambharensis]